MIVQGGVGAVPHDKEEAVIAGVCGAVLSGSDVLASSGSSLDAVETAIRVLEDDPLFNSGTGSVLTFDGEVEMDAAVAYGPGLRFGAIAGIKNIQHPISLARMVMEKTDHVLLQGAGAQGAASGAVNMLSNILDTEAGIVVDNQGGTGFAQNTPQMAYAYFKQGMSEPVAGL